MEKNYKVKNTNEYTFIEFCGEMENGALLLVTDINGNDFDANSVYSFLSRRFVPIAAILLRQSTFFIKTSFEF